MPDLRPSGHPGTGNQEVHHRNPPTTAGKLPPQLSRNGRLRGPKADTLQPLKVLQQQLELVAASGPNQKLNDDRGNRKDTPRIQEVGKGGFYERVSVGVVKLNPGRGIN